MKSPSTADLREKIGESRTISYYISLSRFEKKANNALLLDSYLIKTHESYYDTITKIWRCTPSNMITNCRIRTLNKVLPSSCAMVILRNTSSGPLQEVDWPYWRTLILGGGRCRCHLWRCLILGGGLVSLLRDSSSLPILFSLDMTQCTRK